MDAKMLRPEFYWDMDDDPDGNVVHIAEHDLTPDEVESVFSDRTSVVSVSRSSGRPLVFGWTSTGRHIAVAYDEVNEDPLAIYVITAYEVEP